MLTAIIAGLLAATAAPSGPPVKANVVRQPVSIDAGALTEVEPTVTANGYELYRAADGFFYVDAIVNGAAIRFLIDTGASVVVLRLEDAVRAGLAVDPKQFSVTAETANGHMPMARVTLDEVVVGSVRKRLVAAAVVHHGPGVSLLGQNWLSQLSSMTIAGNRMVLR